MGRTSAGPVGYCVSIGAQPLSLAKTVGLATVLGAGTWWDPVYKAVSCDGAQVLFHIQSSVLSIAVCMECCTV